MERRRHWLLFTLLMCWLKTVEWSSFSFPACRGKSSLPPSNLLRVHEGEASLKIIDIWLQIAASLSAVSTRGSTLAIMKSNNIMKVLQYTRGHRHLEDWFIFTVILLMIQFSNAEIQMETLHVPLTSPACNLRQLMTISSPNVQCGLFLYHIWSNEVKVDV